MKAVSLLLAGFLFFPGYYSARADSTQTARKPFIVALRTHYGFIIPHSESIRSISDSRPWGVELEGSWLLTGDKAWDYCFCHPRMGAAVSYVNFDNRDILGSATSLVYFIEPFLSYNRKFNFSFRTGMGISYLDNTHDAAKNPQNLFYSSPISFLLQLNVALNYRLNSRTFVRLAAYYNHISNGGMREPNKGINYPTLSLGADHALRPVELKARPRIRNSMFSERKTHYEAALLFTAKPTGPNAPRRYPIYGLAAQITRRVGRLSALNAGLEAVVSNVQQQKLRQEQLPGNPFSISVLAGHDLIIGRFEFSTQLGAYLYAGHFNRDPVYQRYGLRFRFNDRFFAGINLKSHREVADFMDVRVGVRF